MTRRSPKVAADPPAAATQDPTESAVELRGEDARGNVRPADNRYLTELQIAARDAYVAEVTGQEAQQLLAKREAPEHVEALNSRDRTIED